MEPGSKLYPAVICEPTTKEMFQFELGSTRVGTSSHVPTIYSSVTIIMCAAFQEKERTGCDFRH